MIHRGCAKERSPFLEPFSERRLKGNVKACKEGLRPFVPGLLQRFVQREFGDRHPCGAGKAHAVKAEVQEEPLYLLGREVQTMLFKEGKNVLAGHMMEKQ